MVVSVCDLLVLVFFFKQKTAYEMRISDWSSDVCSSDLIERHQRREHPTQYRGHSCRVEPCREQWPNPVCAENPFRAEGEAQSATRRCSVDSAVGLYCRIHVIRQADMALGCLNDDDCRAPRRLPCVRSGTSAVPEAGGYAPEGLAPDQERERVVEGKRGAVRGRL